MNAERRGLKLSVSRNVHVKVKCAVQRLFIVKHHRTEALRYGACSQGISKFYLHDHTFTRNRNEPYLPLPSQPQLVLIYRPRGMKG